ncbi:hypothetical protein ACX0G9_00530 [Flavitalea flava]
MTTTKQPNWILAIGMPFLVFVICAFLSFSAVFQSNPSLFSTAITLDLTLTAPLIYFLFIRNTTVSKMTVARAFMIGALLAGWLLYHKSHPLLDLTKKWISPVIEFTVLSFIAYRFYGANQTLKKNRKVEIKQDTHCLQHGLNRPVEKIDFLVHCRAILQTVIGNEKITNIISSEIAVLYYSLIGIKDTTIDNKTAFSSYKKNGVTLLLSVFISLFLIETTGTHFLFAIWNQTIAWIFTGLSLYTCLQLFGHIRAIKARPTRLTNKGLEIRNGLAGDAILDFADVERIEMYTKPITEKSKIISDEHKFSEDEQGVYFVKMALIKNLEPHNILIWLKRPVSVTRLFGIRKTTGIILCFVDQPREFLEAVKERMERLERITNVTR